ncbi:hypothetical protein BAY61_20995 [Prauserella marina]|uniref:histidine kinase n=1 Tax=Prauserella marina TaxID=530584 RepID=A0A222VT44_9PSEU|nr:HAMP domain-containing sensor histidine kinase [Prauserella marina]ASR37050.1 hypothetical protein BAY61_20995 [Prauserella marina]PWV79970.1 two-component system OmpR family sensor kinase [Prauserella marina]SDD85962.1 two-component system, OmpR family, sensor kinase [Prauserella marina]
MSLRTRLIVTVVGLLALGLVLALGATSGALQDWKGEQNDDVLTAAGRHLADTLRERPDGTVRLDSSGTPGDIGTVWRELATDGDVPSLFQLRDAEGKLLQTVGYGPLPSLPDQLPAEHRPDRPSADNPDGERFFSAETALADGATGGPNWLIRTSFAGEHGKILVVGVRTERSDELLSRAMTVAFVSGGVALVAVALLSWRAVRRGLRPLDDIADTAREIGSGDLSRRVPEAKPGTEIGTVSAALNSMLGQLETAFAERHESRERLRRFVADASHELRTPIATIRGHAELFRRGAAERPADLAKVVGRIESEAQRMGELVDELLLLARLDQGSPLGREPVDLTSLAADAVTDALATEPERELTLRAEGPVVVTGDAARLRQVLGNLVSNVLRHTPGEASAVVAVRDTGDGAVVEITDTGGGMSEEELGRVFERFYRADPSRSRGNGGAGLGLSIVAAVVEAHGGRVTVSSAPGEGTMFRVVLPSEDGRT